MNLLDKLRQTAMTWWRRRNVFCPWCALTNPKVTMRSVTTPRGYVLRCWQCGGEYVENEYGLRHVWPPSDRSSE